MKKSFLKKVTASIAAVAMFTGAFICCEAETPTVDENISVLSNYSNSSYSEYLNSSNVSDYSGEKAVLPNSNVTCDEKSDIKLSNNALCWSNGQGEITWKFTVNESAAYNIMFAFKPLSNENTVRFGLKLDGEFPFEDMQTVELTCDWVDAKNDNTSDKNRNETAPEQILADGFYERYLCDSVGVQLSAYKFYLTAGEHTLTLIGDGYTFAVSEIALTAPESPKGYSEISKEYDYSQDFADEIILIEGEKADIKSDNSLIPKATNGSAGMSPASPYTSRLNYIGGSTWNKSGQRLTWNFTVGKAGYYKFGARYKQSDLVNGESWRWLKIDGKTPFAEAKELRFAYGTGWQHYTLGADEPYYIWLDEGEHTLSVEVTLGEMAAFYERLNSVVTGLGNLYLEIVMITGETPDVNFDYELFNSIPEFESVLTDADKKLASIVEDMKNSLGKRGNQYTTSLDSMRRVIKKMLDSRYIAHIYVKDFYTNYTSLCSSLSEMRSMPLSVDCIQLVPYGKDFDFDEPNIIENMVFGVRRFLYSFTDDYGNASAENGKSIKIWVNWGRDQTSVLENLIEDSFTAETGIKVNLQIVSNTLINGLLANNFPDLMLSMSRTDPVNYGIRGALTDLTEFEDYEEVLTRFQTGAADCYKYNDALYALPEQQTYFCMYYRTDIFEQLGLSVPTTWDEFLNCATTIQRYNMSVYIPYTQITATTTVNGGIGSLHLYPTLMMQNGLSIYNDEINATDIDNPQALSVFENWIKMYSDYGYLKEADFYNRFRNGSMPLGIALNTTYYTLYSAAPEIEGRWALATVPGVAGKYNYVAGGGTGCGVVKRSENQQEAWEFIKWWTSAEAQSRYSANVESVLGMLGRIPSANIEAVKKMSFNPSDLNVMLEQWKNVREVPETPGGYYLTRAIDQAFWSVINDGTYAKDAITKWSKIADVEIERKIKEYS